MSSTKCRIYGRFSSKPQEHGDSFRRQTEGAVDYAENQGLELVKNAKGEPLVYFDEGVSGKAGLNLDREFGRLLKEAKAGETILCEETDRIGRQHPIDVMCIIKDRIVQRGLRITFWRRNFTVDQSNIDNPATLFSLFGETTVSFSDNSRKIDRQLKTWTEKRENGANEPLTAICPSWIEPVFSHDEKGNRTTTGFKLIPSHAAIVKRIFELSLKGMGNTAISRFFNKEGIQGIGGVPTWHQSVIDRILRNRAVLGEFQPMKKNSDGKREPEGDPISNYYPKITGIGEEMFNAVQYNRKQRLIAGRGRRGEVLKNLFSGICKCGFCGASMFYAHKRNISLVCSNAHRGVECKYVGYPYEEIETSFLNYVSELDLASVLNPKSNPNDQTAVEIEQCRAKINGIEVQLENLANGIAMGKGKLDILVSRIETLQTESVKHKEILNDLMAKQAASNVNLVKVKEIKQLIAKAQDLTAKDANETRTALREAIRSIVTKIDVFPYEEIPVDASNMSRSEKREATKAGYSLTESVQRVERCLRIHFKNEANFRVIYSHPRYRMSRNLKYIVDKAA